MTFFRKINRGIINALKRCLCIKDKQILDKEGLQFCCALYTSKSAAHILQDALGGSSRHAQRKAANLPFSRHAAASASGFNRIVRAKSLELDISPFYAHVSVKEARFALIPPHIQTCALSWLNIAAADYTTMGG